MNSNDVLDNLKPHERIELKIMGLLIKYHGFVSDKCKETLILQDDRGWTVSVQRDYIEEIRII